ncbi:MAG: methyltransferase domain-containing protein [bacterium]
MRSFLDWWRRRSTSYEKQADAEAAFWGDFTARWIATGIVPPWADVRLAVGQAIGLGHRDRVLGGELENLSRKLRFLRDALHRVSSCSHQRLTNVLDLGCGAGFLSLEMGRQGAQVLGVDLSMGQIAVARYFSKNGMQWPSALYPTYQGIGFRGEDFKPPVYEIADLNREQPDGAFDIVFAHDAIHHLSDPEGLLKRLDPLIQPGGWIFLIDHQETSEREQSWNAFRSAVSQRCAQWMSGALCSDIPRVEPYDRKISFPETLGLDIMHGLGDWLGGEGFPVASISKATADSAPPPWPSEESSFEGVSSRDLGQRICRVLNSLGYEDVVLQTAFEPWREDLVRLRPEGMDWQTFYGIRAQAEDRALADAPNSGDFFYLRAQKAI